MVWADTLQVRSLRLRGAADGLRARQRFEAVLADVTAAALGLPLRALLLVRRVTPSVQLRLDSPSRAAAFGNAVRSELAQRAQQARRPWLHSDAATAGAVLFADEGELVACLVRDWLRSSVAERWWWQSVLRGLPASEWLRRFALLRGDVLPAALAQLASHGEAVAWLIRLDEHDVIRATAAVIAAHAIVVPAEPQMPATPGPHLHDAETHPPVPSRGAEAASTAVRRRLFEVVPELRSSLLTRSQRRLLAIALGVQRAPGFVRGAEFAGALRALEVDAESALADGFPIARPAMDDAVVAEEPDKPVSGALPTVCRSSLAGVPATTTDIVQAPRAIDSSAVATRSTEARRTLDDRMAVVASMPDAPASAQTSLPSIAPLEREETAASQAELFRSESSAPPAATPQRPTLHARQPIETQFGGIFYLLNVALALGLYGDFTQPLSPGIALSPWDWLALVGRTWFGRAFESDAVWRLLAELAGRTLRGAPGLDFTPPDPWSVPADWLLPWGKVDVVDVYVTRRYLHLWHSAGFPLIDVPRIAAIKPLVQARVLCSEHEALGDVRLTRVRKLPRRLGSGGNGRGPLARWLRCLVLYLDARLARALGDDTLDAPSVQVCCHAAQLYCTSTALDIHLSLATLPLAVRIAGLDRDPGWIPAAGRTLAFHFE